MSDYRGVGKWILKQMQGFFQMDSGPSENDELTMKGKFSSIKVDRHKLIISVIKAHHSHSRLCT